MGTKATYETTCDLCGNSTKHDTDGVPKGWMNFLIENRYVDRDFTEKHICNKCAKEISERYKAA